MGPETSVRNYLSTLRDMPEGRISHLLRGGSLRSPVNVYSHILYHISVGPLQPHVDHLRAFGLRLRRGLNEIAVFGDFTQRGLTVDSLSRNVGNKLPIRRTAWPLEDGTNSLSRNVDNKLRMQRTA